MPRPRPNPPDMDGTREPGGGGRDRPLTVGFIGLGTMGMPIARNILAAGMDVVAWNRTLGRTDALADAGAGASVAPTPAAAAADADVLVTMVTDDAALEDLFFGPGGLVSAMPAATAHLSLSTISVAMAARLRDAHGASGRDFVAAPVVGRADRAEARLLYILAAGAETAVARCRPILDAIGQKTFALGPDPCSAVAAKLANNFMIGATIETLAEAFSITDAHGLDREAFLGFLTETLFASPVMRIYGRLMVERAYRPAGSPLAIGLKDMRLAMAAASAGGSVLPLARLVESHLLAAERDGLADHDWAVLADPSQTWRSGKNIDEHSL